MNITISREIFNHIKQRMGQNIEIRFIAACRIWFYSNGVWTFGNIEGGLALGLDKTIQDEINEGREAFFMFDLNTFDVTFRMYLYQNFHYFYKSINQFFYYFRLPNTQSLIGFSFSSAQEAALLDSELQFIAEQEFEQIDFEKKHFPDKVQEYQMVDNFENDKPLHEIDLDKEKDRLQNARLKKTEKDILRNAGISKGEYIKNQDIRTRIVEQFINVLREKKENHESKLHQASQHQPTSNPEANYDNLRKNSMLSQISQVGQAPTNIVSVNAFQSNSRLRQQSTIKSTIKPRQSILYSNPPIIPQAPPLLKLLENDHSQQQFLNQFQSQGSSLGSNKPKVIPPEIKQSLLDEIQGMKYQLKPVVKTNPLNLTKEEGMNLTYKINAQMRERRKEIKKNILDDDKDGTPWDSLDEEDD